MNGDLLLPEATKLFLHRLVRDLKAHLENSGSPEVETTGLVALETALGPCLEPLPTVREMLDLPDAEQEQRGRNLLRALHGDGAARLHTVR
jgi:hypothetical protein